MSHLPRFRLGRRSGTVKNDQPAASRALTREEIVDRLRGAMDLFEAGRDDEAVQRLRPVAEAGDQDARLMLGAWHFEQGDFGAAEPLLRGVAAEGQATAMYLLGAISRGYHHDEETARRWFRAGAARGDGHCIFEVGTCAVHDGDFGLAKFWLGRASVAGSADAMVNLGGLLISEDPEGAHLWWGRAAEKGHPAAIHNVQANFEGSGG